MPEFFCFHLKNGDSLNNPGIIDQYINGIHLLFNHGNSLFYCGFIGDIQNIGVDKDSLIRILFFGGFKFIREYIIDYNGGPGIGQARCDGHSKSMGPACNQGCLPFQIK